VIHKLEGSNNCTEQDHRIAATAIQTKEVHGSKKVHLMFPDGVTCKSNHHNNKNGKLKNNFRLLTPIIEKKANPKDNIIQTVPCLFWEVTSDGESCHLKRQTSDDDDHDFKKAQKHLSNLRI
jgi:hypothetical protein